MVVLIKTTSAASNLYLEKDEQRLEISCGGDLKVVVTVERGKTESDTFALRVEMPRRHLILLRTLRVTTHHRESLSTSVPQRVNSFMTTSVGLFGCSCGDGV
jgi:hypothetical protein